MIKKVNLDKWIQLNELLNEPYGFGLLQDVVSALNTLKSNNLTVKDLKWFVEETKKLLIDKNLQKDLNNLIRRGKDNPLKRRLDKQSDWQEEWEAKAKRCPKCGSMLALEYAGRNVKGYKTVWRCYTGLERKQGCKDCKDDDTDYSNACVYEKYMIETKDEVLKQLGIDMEKYRG